MKKTLLGVSLDKDFLLGHQCRGENPSMFEKKTNYVVV